MRTLFKQIDSFLIENQHFWRFEPFHQSIVPGSPWHSFNEPLGQWLSSLSFSQIEALKLSPNELVIHLSEFIEGLEQVHASLQLRPARRSHRLIRDSHLETGIPGRKLQQIRSMSAALLYQHQGTEWLEWCSGKGFLGRILAAQSKQKVTSFEYQMPLCEAGQTIADAFALPMQFIQGDAFQPEALCAFHPAQHAVALHACGDLHVRLLEYSVAKKLPAISFSPCCYHLIQAALYQAMSSEGQASSLALSQSELRIPLQETVTGGERVRRHRQQEMTYRLGFDLFLRLELGYQNYCPVPSIKKSQLADGFRNFCQWACTQKSIEFPADVDLKHYEEKGTDRFWQMERLSLVQQAFRRIIELWLVLDKAIYLQENGYKVTIEQFCEREITPRNILVHAFKR
ncbi:methyltransferase [Vibrio aestuarianus]|uniref:methyltransferase n=1 Tax=Vibrio aestuarianus TaxID=28171 RepID=UPI001558D913|nr:methyltransferase [Vibrio aestuarianus]NGZ12604.1 methyltransferase [Vibrio aestuarianus]NKZ48752.1 methyltransferase [Vibrio aestuarianus]